MSSDDEVLAPHVKEPEFLTLEVLTATGDRKANCIKRTFFTLWIILT
jgi:hypothetical protein